MLTMLKRYARIVGLLLPESWDCEMVGMFAGTGVCKPPRESSMIKKSSTEFSERSPALSRLDLRTPRGIRCAGLQMMLAGVLNFSP